MKILFWLLLVSVAGWGSDFFQEKTLELPAEGLQLLTIEAGAGELKVEGVRDLKKIVVEARIEIHPRGMKITESWLKDNLTLTLSADGETARLIAKFDDDFGGLLGGWPQAYIHLLVKIPRPLDVTIEDGSGDIEIRRTAGVLKMDDGSGGIEVIEHRGNIFLKDGSGEIYLEDIVGNVEIEDGSGEIHCRQIEGDVLVDDGSGEMNIEQVIGNVAIWDGSGGIRVRRVTGDVTINSDGSGSVSLQDVSGRVIEKQ